MEHELLAGARERKGVVPGKRYFSLIAVAVSVYRMELEERIALDPPYVGSRRGAAGNNRHPGSSMRLPAHRRRQPPIQKARALFLVEPVSEILNVCDNPVLDPDTLHQKVRTKVVRPKFNLDIRVDSRYPVDLGRVTAERVDLGAARTSVDDTTSASHPSVHRTR
jgi:hypothetical protein